ncbi:MAG: hypothetical protein LUE99_15165 [Bacteroides sp.]|nr:hypothetical protein [Bacteroides sp.]
MESDIDAEKWSMSFGNDDNGTAKYFKDDGATELTEATASIIRNGRYQIQKASDGKSLVFTALGEYSATSLENKETLILKANQLEITYNITQVDSSPDDWGNGGNITNDLGGEISAIGGTTTSGQTFEFAPGNLVAIKNANGEYTYHIVSEQGFTSDITATQERIDFFSWNSMIPGKGYVSPNEDYDRGNDPCRKVGNGEWYTPTEAQMKVLHSNTSLVLFGNWKMADGTESPGHYYGASSLPTEATRNQFVFLPAKKRNK